MNRDTLIWFAGSALHSIAVVGIGLIIASQSPQIVHANDRVIEVPLTDSPVASAPILAECRG